MNKKETVMFRETNSGWVPVSVGDIVPLNGKLYRVIELKPNEAVLEPMPILSVVEEM